MVYFFGGKRRRSNRGRIQKKTRRKVVRFTAIDSHTRYVTNALNELSLFLHLAVVGSICIRSVSQKQSSRVVPTFNPAATIRAAKCNKMHHPSCMTTTGTTTTTVVRVLLRLVVHQRRQSVATTTADYSKYYYNSW